MKMKITDQDIEEIRKQLKSYNIDASDNVIRMFVETSHHAPYILSSGITSKEFRQEFVRFLDNL